MDFSILGPLEVREGGRVLPLGGAKQRALLAMLLVHANELVPSDRLIDELWGEARPEAAAKALSVAVARLRKVLAQEGSAAGTQGVLRTHSPGYELRVARGRLDLHRFEDLANAGRRASDPASAARDLHAALSLWRGPPLADLSYASFLQPEIARLEELRMAALEERVDADLALGRHAELVGELEAGVGAHPLRERLRAQLILALYRS